jgi:hypothetical protein
LVPTRLLLLAYAYTGKPAETAAGEKCVVCAARQVWEWREEVDAKDGSNGPAACSLVAWPPSRLDRPPRGHCRTPHSANKYERAHAHADDERGVCSYLIRFYG